MLTLNGMVGYEYPVPQTEHMELIPFADPLVYVVYLLN